MQIANLDDTSGVEESASTDQLHVYAFGKLRLTCGPRVVAAFPTQRVESLLGYLLLHPNTLHTREKLIDILWADQRIANGRASFSTALWRLRSIFEALGLDSADYLQVSRDWVGFISQRPFYFDITDFEEQLNLAQQTTEAAEQEAALQSALAIYQGQFCEGLYAEWSLLERERLERDYLRGMGRLMACLMDRQAYAEAATLGQTILQRDPIREEVHQAVMYCYMSLGQYTRAVRQFQRCARLLQNELRVMPMSDTIALYRQIIEARLAASRNDISAETAYHQQVQEAFDQFQAAAERLNRLLEEEA